MTIVRISHNSHIVPSATAYADVMDTAAGEYNFISDATARTIASWWQSPGCIGRELASLASGVPVDLADLLADIEATVREKDQSITAWENEHDAEALYQLREWAIDAGYSDTDEG